MSDKEIISFKYLVIEFDKLKQDIHNLRTDTALLNEITKGLVEFKNQFNPNNGLLTRLVQAVSDEWKSAFKQFKQDDEKHRANLPCAQIDWDEQNMVTTKCRIANEKEPLGEDEKRL
jgi:hypothetical protein